MQIPPWGMRQRWYVEVASKSLYTFLKQPKEKLFDVAKEHQLRFKCSGIPRRSQYPLEDILSQRRQAL
ncbi:hypothetical protein DRN39_06300 [Thermococci archaeon]|nr:MAG: hypothetical protein DRN39_06300 [Thermococci archaeon]